MCNDRIIRRFAGAFILASLALGHWVHPAWFLFTAFVGLNLLQSSFTAVCPLERMLGRWKRFGCTPHQTPGRSSWRRRSPGRSPGRSVP